MRLCQDTYNRRAENTFKDLESKLHKVHNNKYSYYFTVYSTSKAKVAIACPSHGLFEQSLDKHLQGRGCPKCADKARGDCKRSSTAEFIRKAKAIHGTTYDYSNTSYGNIANDMVKIHCYIHGDFHQTANSHLSGHGCNKCAELARRRNYLDEPTILYYLYFPNKDVYKIGITVARRGVAHRYCADTEEYIIIDSIEYPSGKQAYNNEQLILATSNNYKYYGEDILIGGNSELFCKNILKDYDDKIEQYLKNESKGKKGAILEP